MFLMFYVKVFRLCQTTASLCIVSWKKCAIKQRTVHQRLPAAMHKERTVTVLEETVQASNPNISEHQTDTVQPGPARKSSDYIKHQRLNLIRIIMYSDEKTTHQA